MKTNNSKKGNGYLFVSGKNYPLLSNKVKLTANNTIRFQCVNDANLTNDLKFTLMPGSSEGNQAYGDIIFVKNNKELNKQKNNFSYLMEQASGKIENKLNKRTVRKPIVKNSNVFTMSASGVTASGLIKSRSGRISHFQKRLFIEKYRPLSKIFLNVEESGKTKIYVIEGIGKVSSRKYLDKRVFEIAPRHNDPSLSITII